jgi:hypothetical protein
MEPQRNSPPTTATLLDDPLAGWANDDLLFADDTRAHFRTYHSAALDVFDWPELRARFAEFDKMANAARRRSRSGGTQAVLVGFVALLIAAIMPVMTLSSPDGVLARLLGSLSALLAVAATIWGYSQLLTGRRKAEWLSNRYWTERLRQLNFQFIISNLTLAVALMRDPQRKPEWDSRRAAALAEFQIRYVRSVTESFQRMREDDAEEEFWINEEWQQRPALPLPSTDLDTLFALLKMQRFDIQKRFSILKTTPGIHSASTRAAIVAVTSNILTVVTLVGTIAYGLVLAMAAQSTPQLWSKLITAGIAISAATIIFLRTMNDGLQFTSETERYNWYRASVGALSARYNDAELAGRIELLRDMERLSYQEMRWFLNSFHDAKFVI